MQMEAYASLRESLVDSAEAEYYRIFPARRHRPDDYRKEILRKTQEVARYVVPVAALTYLYHTISGVTLLRYWRMCLQGDVPHEQRQVVEQMIQTVLDHDPAYGIILEEPLAPEDATEFTWLEKSPGTGSEFRKEFDATLQGHTTKLLDYQAQGEATVASAVREVLGLSGSELSDDEAIALALDPGKNPLHGEILNLTTQAKLTRVLHHPSYTFRKRLSHAADSQDQRHRMTPASRPILATQITDDPDYVTPDLIRSHEPSLQIYKDTMRRTWEAIMELKRMGIDDEFTNYLLPNAVAIRFTESTDLLNLHHKHRMRLCYNAQEEIWRASLDEAAQVREVHPRLGRYLLPPCTLRKMAGARPICPEGERYCGVPVWKLDISDYKRLL
jgi:thymidylate synthase ThyX